MAAELLEIHAYRDPTGTLVELSGALKLENCAAAKARLTGLLQDGEAHPFYLHLGQVSELDSAGLGVLFGLHVSARKSQIELQLLAPTAFQMKLLTATKLVSLLAILHGVQAESIWQRLARPELAIPVPDP